MTTESTTNPLDNGTDLLTLDQLEALLRHAEVPVDSWGVGSAKTLQHLFDEIKDGETQLVLSASGELARYVGVVLMDVIGANSNGDQFKLVEDRQEFKDGRVRRRSLDTSIGEKVKSGESRELAAERALREELGVTDAEVHWVRSEKVENAPTSYPGLKSYYDAHRFEALIPDEAFNPDGYIEEQADKTNYYIWQPIENDVTERA